MSHAYGTKYYYEMMLHSSIKNYSGEFEQFVDWISPFLEETPGMFVGYTLFEEGDKPKLHFVK